MRTTYRVHGQEGSDLSLLPQIVLQKKFSLKLQKGFSKKFNKLILK